MRRRLVDTFQRAVPDEVALAVCRLVGCGTPLRTIDLEPLRNVSTVEEELLTDPRRLEHELLSGLGLNGDLPSCFPAALHRYLGRGVESWQYPCQFGPFLAEVARHRVESYLEIGVMHGGTFAVTVEYLTRVAGLQKAFHDIVDAASPGVRQLWAELNSSYADRYDFHEFTAQYPEVRAAHGQDYLGIGLIVPNQVEPTPSTALH